MMRNWGLKRKFVTIFLVFITLPTAVYGILIYYQTTEVLKNQLEEDIVEMLDKDEQSFLSIIRDVESMSSYMTYNKDFRTFFKASEDTSAAYKSSIEGINGYFTFQLMSNEYISSILLKGTNGDVFVFGEPVFGDEKELDQAAIAGKGSPVWSDAYEVMSEWAGEKYVISLSREINDLKEYMGNKICSKCASNISK